VATPNIQVILQGILTVTNNLVSPAPYIANFDFQNPTIGSTSIFYDPYLQAPTGGIALSLPAAIVYVMAVQNLSTTQNLTVTITPNAGAASPITLGPGGVYLYFDPQQLGQGISAVTLTGIGATVSAFVLAAAGAPGGGGGGIG